MPQPGAALTTFTFLHVDIPERLRGRGAQLVVRATPPDAATERPNTAVTLPVDAVADWNCRSGGG
jgi:hypothetical protein